MTMGRCRWKLDIWESQSEASEETSQPALPVARSGTAELQSCKKIPCLLKSPVCGTLLGQPYTLIERSKFLKTLHEGLRQMGHGWGRTKDHLRPQILPTYIIKSSYFRELWTHAKTECTTVHRNYNRMKILITCGMFIAWYKYQFNPQCSILR